MNNGTIHQNSKRRLSLNRKCTTSVLEIFQRPYKGKCNIMRDGKGNDGLTIFLNDHLSPCNEFKMENRVDYSVRLPYYQRISHIIPFVHLSVHLRQSTAVFLPSFPIIHSKKSQAKCKMHSSTAKTSVYGEIFSVVTTRHTSQVFLCVSSPKKI